MKKSGRFLLGCLVVLLSCAVSPSAGVRPRKVALFLWNEEPRYVIVKENVIRQLRKEGFKEPDTEYAVYLASGNKVTADRIARRLPQEGVDLIVPIGTSATFALSREVTDIPIVFALVYDPVEANIVQSMKSSGNNMTGVTSMVTMARLLRMAKMLHPIHELGVVYTPGEVNSETQRRALEARQKDFGIHVLPIPVRSKKEIVALMPYAIQKVDTLYIAGGGIVSEFAADIAAIAIRHKMMTITHVGDPVARGILLGVSVDPADVGRMAGEKAALVLRGAAPSSLEIGVPQKMDVLLNRKTARAIGLAIPLSFRRFVTKEIQ